MALFSFDDVAARAASDVSSMEERGDALVEDVSASIQLFTGQQFTRGTWTFRTRIKGSFIRLPQRPVHDVDSVRNIDGDDVGFEWDGIDRVYVHGISGFPWVHLERSGRRNVVDVTYDAGPDETPAVIVGIGSAIVLRTLGVDPMNAGIRQESVDGYSYMIGSAGGAGAYGLLPDEHRVLDHYRRLAGSIALAR